MTLTVVPAELVEANQFIAALHRHHAPVVGHRFSLACVDDDGLVRGVCVVGRPIARLAGSPRDVAEVTRLATDGTYNACSILYAAAARAARAMGFRRIQTYTLPSEGGASLRASGWVEERTSNGDDWQRTDRPGRADQTPLPRTRWARNFDRAAFDVRLPDVATDLDQGVLL